MTTLREERQGAPHHLHAPGRAALFDPRFGRPTVLQVSVLIVSAVHVAWAVAGLMANPSFATGSAATSVAVLGMDYNGWHAIAGLGLFIPGLILARRPDWSRLFVGAVIPSGVLPAIWAFFDDRPLGLLAFDNAWRDIVLHPATAALLAALLALDFASSETAAGAGIGKADAGRLPRGPRAGSPRGNRGG